MSFHATPACVRVVPVQTLTQRHVRIGAGAPTPKESLLEFQAWKASVRKQELLLAGAPLPPDLLLPPGSAAPLALEAPPASSSASSADDAAAAPSGEPRKPAPLPAAGAPVAKQRCPLRTAGVSRAQFLASLDAATTIPWGSDVFAPLAAALAADDPALAAA